MSTLKFASPDTPLSESVRRLLQDQAVLAQLPDLISFIAGDHTILYINRTLTGQATSDIVGSSALRYVVEEDRARYCEVFERVWRTGVTESLSFRSPSNFIWKTRFTRVHDYEGMPLMFGTSLEISAQMRAEDALRESEEQLRHAVEASGMGSWSWDLVRGEICWDGGLCKIFGIDSETAPRTFETYLQHIHPEDRERVQAQIANALHTGVYSDFEHRVVRKDGAVRNVLCRGATVRSAGGVSVGLRGGVFDITERKSLEEQLRQLQKMEAIGQLTAGIAHNFNNLLSIILPNLELARIGASDQTIARLADAEHAALRAADLVRQLMPFAREDRSRLKAALEVGSVLRRTAGICESTFARRITIQLSLPELPAYVMARAGDIEQVLLNICINARDAFDDAGTVKPVLRLSAELATNDRVRLIATDNGPGMSADIRARIFDPFFTTKDVGRGTGLGLASAYAIVAEHGGRILCESVLGTGTTFVIELPLVAEAPSAAAPVGAASGVAGGHETVLLVDDEALLRRALRATLESAGFTVLEAANAREALAACTRPDLPIDLVVVDLSMPDMQGDQLIPWLRAHGMKAPVVVLTGHVPEHVAVRSVDAVLLKPPATSVLLDTIRVVLDRHSSAG